MNFIRIVVLGLVAAVAVVFQFDIFGIQTALQFLCVDPAAGVALAMAAIVAPFPVDSELTSIVVAYKNEKLIADQVAPRVPVGLQNFKYKKYSLADSFTILDTRVGRTGAVNQVNFGYTEADSSCEDHALDGLVPLVDIENAPAGYDPVAHQARSVMDLVLLDREKRVSDLIFNAANYADANNVTLEGNSQWSDFVNSDPVKAILDALDLMVMRANKMVIGQAVWTVLRQHPKVMKATNKNSGDSGAAAREAVAELLELDEIIVGSGWHNSAKPGQAVTKTRLWGKFCALIYQDAMASISDDRITFAITAQFGSRVSGKIPDPKMGMRGGMLVRSGESVRELITANDLGYLFSDAVA